jgi:hypothetical protein
MECTLGHIHNWETHKPDHDLMINCTLDYYSNEAVRFFDQVDTSSANYECGLSYSYFLRSDYRRTLIRILKANPPVMPLQLLFLLFQELQLQPKNEIHLVVTDGLGNRLFQIASMYAICIINKLALSLFICPNKHSTNDYDFITKKFNSTSMEHIRYLKTMNQLYVEDQQKLYDIDHDLIHKIQNANNSCVVSGYFQSNLYFKRVLPDVLEIFRCPAHLESSIMRQYPKIHNTWFVHVRLGDYVENDFQRNKHFVDLTHYYENHLSDIPCNEPIYLFSDDSYENILHAYPIFKRFPNVQFINESDELRAFYMISFCQKGGICANSTFSWWAAQLNRNPLKRVYMPSKMINTYNGTFNMNP